MNTIIFVTGDPSGDGHGRTSNLSIKTNLSKKEIELAYKKGVELIGFNLIDECCNDYEDNVIYEEELVKLKAAGFEIDDTEMDWRIYHQEYEDIYLFFILKGNPEFKYEIVSSNNTIDMGGYGLFRT